jgi:hypothetical protein
MRNTKTLLVTAFLLIGTARAIASDDLTVVSKLTKNGKSAGTETNYMSSDHVRMGRDEGTSTIVDLKSGTMTTLDDKKKTYYSVTKQDLEQMQAKMQEKMNDPQTKKAMEAMQGMPGAMSFTPQVAKTGVKRKIAGFNCEEWSIAMSPMMTTKECVTTELTYPVRAFDGYKEFAKGMRNMMSGFGPIAKSGADLAEKLKSMKGFPVATSSAIDVMGMKQTTETEVIEVRHSEIPASVWEIPAGYTKIENPMMKAFQRHAG